MALPSLLSALHRDNRRMLGKLAVIALAMFGFGYALVPMYRAICEALGINVLSLAEQLEALEERHGPVAARTLRLGAA